MVYTRFDGYGYNFTIDLFLIKRTRHIYIICLTCLFLLRLWPDIHGISLTAIFFFSLGSEFSIRKRNFVVDMYKISNITNILFAVLLAIILMQCLHIYIMDFSVFPLFLVVGVVFLFNLTSSYVRRNISKKIISQNIVFLCTVLIMSYS